MIRTPMLLEAFWPSRRIMQFDEFCRPARSAPRTFPGRHAASTRLS
jgi:hypothetical protein